MDAFRKQASKLREQVVKQQQVSLFTDPFRNFTFFFLLTSNPHLGSQKNSKLIMGFETL